MNGRQNMIRQKRDYDQIIQEKKDLNESSMLSNDDYQRKIKKIKDDFERKIEEKEQKHQKIVVRIK